MSKQDGELSTARHRPAESMFTTNRGQVPNAHQAVSGVHAIFVLDVGPRIRRLDKHRIAPCSRGTRKRRNERFRTQSALAIRIERAAKRKLQHCWKHSLTVLFYRSRIRNSWRFVPCPSTSPGTGRSSCRDHAPAGQERKQARERCRRNSKHQQHCPEETTQKQQDATKAYRAA